MDWSRGNGCNGLGTGAVGYWGRDIYMRIQADQQHAKERALLMNQIQAGGMRFDLWQDVESGQQCSCYKEINRSADDKCMACHGRRYVPGYLKFGYETLWMSAVDTDVTFTNTEITTEFKSSKVVLSTGSLSGTVESGDKAFSRTEIGSVWEADAQTYIRIAGQSDVTVEYSLDSGGTWSGISNLATANPASGVIRFRATLTRSTAAILSPLFEIVRARYATIPVASEQPDGTFRVGPWVLLMKSVPVEKKTKNEHGDRINQDNTKMWTAGLSMFDSSIEVGSTGELIRSKHTVFKALDGVQAGTFYVMSDWMLSDPFGMIIVSQTFTARMADPSGPYYLIW